MQLLDKNNKSNLNKLNVHNLISLKTGTKGEIAHFGTKDSKKLHKMLVMGLLPGSTIELKQKFPSYILKVDYTQVAIDKETAKDIFLKVK